MHRPSCVKFHRPVAQKSVALVGLIRVRRCRLSSLGIRQLHHTLDALQSLRAIAWRHSHISRRVSDTVHWQVSDSLSVCARAPCVRAHARVWRGIGGEDIGVGEVRGASTDCTMAPFFHSELSAVCRRGATCQASSWRPLHGRHWPERHRAAGTVCMQASSIAPLAVGSLRSQDTPGHSTNSASIPDARDGPRRRASE